MAFETIGTILDRLISNIDQGLMCGCQLRLEPDRGDSVLEERFWHMFRKSVKGWHGAADQVQIGAFRVDCLVDCDGQLVVVELDGAKYHNALDDELRDKEILKSVDAIIRIPFAALWYYRYAVFEVMATWFPRFQLKASHGLTLNASEFHANVRDYQDDYYTLDEYLDEIEHSYNIWEVGGDMAIVGSPSGFLGKTRKRHRVWVQRGQRDPGLVSPLYTKSGCRPMAVWTV